MNELATSLDSEDYRKMRDRSRHSRIYATDEITAENAPLIKQQGLLRHVPS